MNPKFRKLSKYQRAIYRPFRFLHRTLFPVSFVKHQYRYLTRNRLNFKNPARYTEKLQYLRLFVYPNDLLVVKCAGREGARQYLTELGFHRYLIPTYGLFDCYKDIDFNILPKQFVLKCTHGCAYNHIFLFGKDDATTTVARQFKRWLKTDYGKLTLERHYSPIKPQILIEKYLSEDNQLPVEYKIHVYNGVAKNLYVVTGRGIDIRYTNFYIDWTPFDGSQFNGWVKADNPINKPENFLEMVQLSEKLGKPFPFVRVDLYNIDGKIYFNEMTFTPAKGTLILDVDQTDYEIGKWLDISKYLKGKRL